MARREPSPPRPVLLLLLPYAMALACAAITPALGRQVHTDAAEATPSASTATTTSALLAAATPAANAQQTALRKAIANAAASPVTFTLTTDIVLTAPLPFLQPGAKVTIVGMCKDRYGNTRSCIIDGAGKHAVFTGNFVCDIRLERLVIQNVFGSVHAGACSFSAQHVVFRNNVGPRGVVLDARDFFPIQGSPDLFAGCNFVNNTAVLGNGGVFNVGKDPIGGPTLSFFECTFRNNRAINGVGGVIYSEGNAMIFRDVVFEGNSAASGGAIVTTASALTIINTTFANNVATNGRGGAIAVMGTWVVGTHRVCRSTFRGNVANPTTYRSSNNIAFLTGTGQAKVGFCPGPVPGGIQAPKTITLVQNCTGCTGCDSDCYGHGRCLLDADYAFPSCSCRGFYEDSSSCTECLQGYTVGSQCTQCSLAYYHPKSKPQTCALCPGLSKVLLYERMVRAVNNVTAATGPLQCQRYCNSTQQPFNGVQNPQKYCNMWIFMAQRTGVPAACAGKCFMLKQFEHCEMKPIQRIASYGITYQYLEPDFHVCDE